MEDRRPRVGLTDAVQAVRTELLAAVVDAGSEEVRVALSSMELEFAIDFCLADDGRVHVLVLSAGADESAGSDELDELYKLEASESEPEEEDDHEQNGDEEGVSGIGGDQPGD